MGLWEGDFPLEKSLILKENARLALGHLGVLANVTVLVDETTWAGFRDLPESRLSKLSEQTRTLPHGVWTSASTSHSSMPRQGQQRRWSTAKDAGGLWRTHLWALGLGIYCKVL